MRDYIEQAMKTESLDKFKVDNPRLLHAVIGVNTEVIEMVIGAVEDEPSLENLFEEMGDICWYMAIACDEMKISFNDLLLLADEVEVGEDSLAALFSSAGNALDLMKKSLFYGVELDTAKFGTHLGTVLRCLDLFAHEEGWTLSAIQEGNIAKLRARYGEKFTTEAAINRNVEAEMGALSGSQA